MLPSILSREVKTGIRRFLESTFPCSTKLFEGSLQRLMDEPDAVFKGPFYSMRLPFEADGSGANPFDRVRYPYRPHKHQALAFQRLAGEAPKSTIVATGTGSGKTECFLYPILDHCARHASEPGIKAIIIYPMNALATDQAKRFASAVNTDPALKDFMRVGMYVGGDGENRKVMSPDGVITDRPTMRNNPPDILMTNYKMLDYLLIRPDDRELWANNASETLKFIVVDELHTFDGAQATDLGCLLRRLRARLKTPDDHLCYVGTSATVGSGDRESELLDYAGALFGTPFDNADCIIREHVVSEADFTKGFYIKHAALPGKEEGEALRPGAYASQLDYLRAQYRLWFGKDAPADIDNQAWRLGLGQSLREHSVMRNLLQFFETRQKDRGQRQISERELLQELALFSEDLQDEELAYQVFDSLCSLCGFARFRHDADGGIFPLLKIHVHLWFRELSRMVATVEAGQLTTDGKEDKSHSPKIRFSSELKEREAKRCLPIIHCRECGSMGWGALQRANEDSLIGELDKFYQGFFGHDPKLRFVYPLAGNPTGLLPEALCGHCLNISQGTPDTCPSCGQSDRMVPVFIHSNNIKRKDHLEADTTCPHCQSNTGVTILGSRSASLSSVALGQMFATRFNDDKQTLAFSDNVQDASHRASFFAARTYRTTLRTAICEVLRGCEEVLTLDAFENAFLEYWKKQLSAEDFVGTFLAPNMEWIEDYEKLRKEGFLASDSSLPADVAKRLAWEIVSEFGYQSRIGRTLERSGAAVAYLPGDVVASHAEQLCARMKELAGGFSSIPEESYQPFLVGLIHRLRTIGGVDHAALKAYYEDQGALFALNKAKWTPGFSYRGRSPSAFTMGSAAPKKLERVVSTGSTLSWLERWATKCFPFPGGLSKDAAATLIEKALDILTKEQTLVEGNTKSGNRYWLIRKEKLQITSEVTPLVCTSCGHRISSGKPESLAEIDLPCLNPTCEGRYKSESEKVDYFGDLYRTGDVARIHAEEHTGLIPREEREWIERRFIGAEDKRKTDPNLLSCTPTLEMGIDIGDLSSVLLCSVPPQTANYVQRVGRAGRRDGNAFSLTVANAQAHDLYYYREPVEMMGGAVEPPGVFFSAPAVLQRQFLAFCFDQWIAKTNPKPFVPEKISPALNNVLSPADPPSGFPYDLLAYVKKHRATALDEFISLFGELLTEQAKTDLAHFAHGEGTSNDSIDGRVVNRLRTYANELEDLKQRRNEVRTKLRKLEAVTPKDEALETELEELSQTAKGLTGIIATIRNTKTLQFFTDEGLLPNYAFPEEGVTLRSIILRKKEKKSDDREGNYRAETLEYQRPAASAIRELAPGSSFYVQHRRLTVDQVNLRISEPERWNFCDQCAHIERLDDKIEPKACCPVCGSSGWADASMRRWMIPLRQVITTEFDRYSRTHDESDERSPEFFDSQISVSIPPDEVEKAYQVKNSVVPFGFEFVRQATMRTVNLGQQSFSGESEMLAGQERTAKGFRICPQCGKVKGVRKGGDNKFRHDITCPRRGKPEEEDADLPAYFLYRELTSEALRLLVPSVGGSQNDELDSFIAALQLGLEAHFKGNIDHLGSCTEIRPLPESSFSRVYLVVYDKVPGGTGYLKELSLDSSRIIKVLNAALEILKECQCKAEDDKDGCHRCVLKKRRSSGASSEPKRSVAIQILEQILNQGEEIEEITSVAKIDINPLIESQLEKRFIDALGAIPDATLKTELISGKNGYILSTGQHQWEIVPQVEISVGASEIKTRADFVIQPIRKKDSLPIAVYLDGFAYHADEAAGKNRVAKDIVQREALRASGKWIVWSLTWEDLLKKLAPGKWTHPGLEETQKTRRQRLLKAISEDLAKHYSDKEHLSSWDHLVAYLQQPDPTRTAEYAYCKALSLAQIQPVSAGILEQRLEQMLEQNLEGITDIELNQDSKDFGFVDSFDHGRWLIALNSDADGLKSRSLKALRAIIRFDDHTRLEQSEFHSDWQGLLRLQNLLQFVPGIHFTTERAIRDGLETFTTDNARKGQPIASETATETRKWGLEPELVHESLSDLIKALEKTEIPEPVCGYELIGPDESIVAEGELAWEAHKTVVLTEDQIAFKDLFEEHGWRTFVSSESEPLNPETLSEIFT